jgi:HK97 family phage major capsid protein
MGVDAATMELRKALNTASGTGSNLIPEVVSEGLRRFVEFRSPLYTLVPKRDWPTNTYIFRSQTALPSASFKADGATLDAADNATYAKPTVAMKYIYARGEVTGPMQAAAGSLFDAMQLEIEAHADALVREIELTLIGGDSGVTAAEFDGFTTQITQEHDAASTALSLSHLDTALDVPADYPSHIIMSRAMGRKLWSLLQAQQRFVDRVEVEGGFRLPAYNDLPIIRVDNDADTDLATTILMPDMRWVTFAINQHITYEPLAKTKDSDDFMLKMYCTLAVEGAARYHVKMVNVTTS